ncbi:hypothetical protein D3C72_1842860 [compost metagenome]
MNGRFLISPPAGQQVLRGERHGPRHQYRKSMYAIGITLQGAKAIAQYPTRHRSHLRRHATLQQFEQKVAACLPCDMARDDA